MPTALAQPLFEMELSFGTIASGPHLRKLAVFLDYRTRRDYVVARLRKIPGVKANEPQGAFYAYPNVSVAYGEESPIPCNSTEGLAR